METVWSCLSPKNVLVQRSTYSGKKDIWMLYSPLASGLERKVRKKGDKGDERMAMFACNYLQETKCERKSENLALCSRPFLRSRSLEPWEELDSKEEENTAEH